MDPHRIYASALSGVGAKRRPPPPFHLGGATPQLSHQEHLQAAVFLASRVLKHCATIEQDLVAAQLQLARKVLMDPSRDDVHYREYGRLKQRVDVRHSEPQPIAKALHGELKSNLWSSLTAGETGLGKACLQLLARSEPDPAATTFLVELDAELCRLDAFSALERAQLSPSKAIRKVLFRAAAGVGKTSYLLCELDGGGHGLFHPLAQQWTWTEGPRDDLLAHLPEAELERAALMLRPR